jgi:hypothetical protein
VGRAVGIVDVVTVDGSGALAVGSAAGRAVGIGLPVGPFVGSSTTIGNVVG